MPASLTPNPIDPPFRPILELPKRVPWKVEWIELNKFWWKRPQNVRILMYLDSASFDGGSFWGLQHVINAVESDPWPWAKFIVTTANRSNDAAADQDNVSLTDLDLDSFDEVWLFGISSNVNQLSAAEVDALESFMDGGGGVLTTGDHDALGRGLSGSAKRIKDLRDYSNTAPSNSPPDWNTTIRDGDGNGTYSFVEQSDAVPQKIRPRYRYHWGAGFWNLKRSPHPLLCSEQGVLTTLPDHQHEGVVTIPNSFPVADWPKIGSFQPKPEVVAWGRIVDPDATNTGGQFPVIGAYNGHGVNVGRIVADSTWHHWFDINLDGFNPASNDYRDITSYFQNVAAWLAPKDKQAGMRNGVFWITLHQAAFQQHHIAKLPLLQAIPLVRDALGQYAPQCLVNGWIFELLPAKLERQVVGFDGPPDLALPLDDAILVEAVAEMQDRLEIRSGRFGPPEQLDVIPEAIKAAAPRAARRLQRECEATLKGASAVVEELSGRREPAKKPSAGRRTAKKPTAKRTAGGGKKGGAK